MGASPSITGNRYENSASQDESTNSGNLGDTLIRAKEIAEHLSSMDASSRKNSEKLIRARYGYVAKPCHDRHPFTDYRFEKILGEGAFSKVYKCQFMDPSMSGKSGESENHHVVPDARSSRRNSDVSRNESMVSSVSSQYNGPAGKEEEEYADSKGDEDGDKRNEDLPKNTNGNTTISTDNTNTTMQSGLNHYSAEAKVHDQESDMNGSDDDDKGERKALSGSAAARRGSRTRNYARRSSKGNAANGHFGSIKQQRYAIKEIVLKNLSRQQLANVEHEVEILSQLDHPDIVGMHEVYKVPDKLFIVLEYLRGGELLKAICQRQRYTEDDARALVLQFVEGVRHIHSRGVIHRDIKPENLILANKSLGSPIKIVDFGFACLCDLERENSMSNVSSEPPSEDCTPTQSPLRTRKKSLTKSISDFATGFTTRRGSFKANNRILCGTPGYIAPEVIKERDYTTKCDTWSIGVVLYIILSGTMPFSVKSDKFVLTGTYSFPEERWITVTESAKDLIRKLLTLDVKERLSAEEILGHKWMSTSGTANESMPTMGGANVTRSNSVNSTTSRTSAVVATGVVSTTSTRADEMPMSVVAVRSIKSRTSESGQGGSNQNLQSLEQTITEDVELTSAALAELQQQSQNQGIHKTHGSNQDIARLGSTASNATSVTVGDLTGNIASLRRLTHMKKFFRAATVISAMSKFKASGVRRARRRSVSDGDVLEGKPNQDDDDDIIDESDTAADAKNAMDTHDGDENEQTKMDDMSDQQARTDIEGDSKSTPIDKHTVDVIVDTSAKDTAPVVFQQGAKEQDNRDMSGEAAVIEKERGDGETGKAASDNEANLPSEEFKFKGRFVDDESDDEAAV